MTAQKRFDELLTPATVAETAAHLDLNFHRLMLWLRRGAIEADTKIPGVAKKKLSVAEQFLALVTRDVTNAGLHLNSAVYLNERFLRFRLDQLRNIPTVPRFIESGDMDKDTRLQEHIDIARRYREFIAESFQDIVKDVFLVAEPTTAEVEQFMIQHDPQMKKGEPIVIGLNVIGPDRFGKNLAALGWLKTRFTLISIDAILQEFLDRLWAYAEGREFKPAKPDEGVAEALKIARELNKVR
jgi:hypothetical protein